jgi:cytochrome c peroxidase
MSWRRVFYLFLAGLLFVFIYLYYCLHLNKIIDKQIVGQHLFFDTQLSLNNTKSCSSCHNPKFAFADGYRKSVTALGNSTLHNSPSLINVADHVVFDWANPTVNKLKIQMRRPLFGENPIELGTHKNLTEIKKYLQNTKPYNSLIPSIYGTITNENIEEIIIESIYEYLLTLKSSQSKYDKFSEGKTKLSASEMRGLYLFLSDSLACSQCHEPPSFTLATKNSTIAYANTGLYNIAGLNIYPASDNGIIKYTGLSNDNGKYKIPSLRNLAFTAPYFHDGSAETLRQIIDIYAAGGRSIKNSPFSGNGSQNLLKDPRIRGFTLTERQKTDLLAFLYTLTDSSFIYKSNFQNPWVLR